MVATGSKTENRIPNPEHAASTPPATARTSVTSPPSTVQTAVARTSTGRSSTLTSIVSVDENHGRTHRDRLTDFAHSALGLRRQQPAQAVIAVQERRRKLFAL